MSATLDTSTDSSFAAPFSWRRALSGASFGLFLLVGASVQPTFEAAELPRTNFDPGWVNCNTIAYGWPLGVLRFQADADCSPGALPDVEPFELCVDLFVACSVLLVLGLVAGGPRAAVRQLFPSSARSSH